MANYLLVPRTLLADLEFLNCRGVNYANVARSTVAAHFSATEFESRLERGKKCHLR